MANKKSKSRTFGELKAAVQAGTLSKSERTQLAGVNKAFQAMADQCLSVTKAWEAEAKALLQVVGDDKTIAEMEGYLRCNPPSAGAMAILVSEAVERERERVKEEKKKSFVPVQKKGTQKIVEVGCDRRNKVKNMNADLLKKPANEGWKLDVRAKHIAEKTGYEKSYVRRLIATPRKTNQT